MGSVDWASLPEGFLQGLSAQPNARLVCRSWGREIALGVTKLSVSGEPPRDGIFGVFACITHLEWICVYRRSLQSVSLIHLHSLVIEYCKNEVLLEICTAVELPCLTLLDVSWSDDLTKKGLQELWRLTRLQSLDLRGCERIRTCNISNPGLTSLHMGALKRLERTAFVRNLHSLTALDFTYCENISCVSGISSLHSLRLLSLKGTAIRTVGDCLPPLSLTSLDLSSCTDLLSLNGLGRLSALTSLGLNSSRVTDAMLQEICEQLGAHGALRHLDLTHSHLAGYERVTDDGLKEVSRIRSLTSLVLDYNYHITDVGLAHVGRLTSLTSLDLWQCSKITEEGLSELKGKLESLTTTERLKN